MGESVAFTNNTVEHLLLFLLNELIASRLYKVLQSAFHSVFIHCLLGHGTRLYFYYEFNIIR